MIDLLLVGSFHSSFFPGGVKIRRLFYTTSCYYQGWGKGNLFQGEGHSVWVNLAKEAEGDFTSKQPLESTIHLSCRFHYWLCCCYCSLSYLIAISSKLVLPQPTIITFCVTTSPLQYAKGRRGKGKEERVKGRETEGERDVGTPFVNHHKDK